MPDTNRILHLISPDGNWEPFARVTAIAASMREQGFASIIAAPDHSRLWELAEAAGVEVVDFALEKSLNPLRWREVGDMITKTGAGLVHAHDRESAMLLKRARLFAKDAAVATSRYDLQEAPHAAEFGRGVDMVICPSEAMAEAMRGRGAPAEKIRVVYDGASMALADRSADEREAIRARLRELYAPGKEKPLFLVNISPLDGTGGHADMLEIMPDILAALPQTHLFLMGEGEEAAELKRRINILAIGDGVSIIEPDKAFHRMLAGADVYVAPSGRDVSGFMVQAAMMAGRGVAARRGGCYGELIEDGKSGVFAKGDGAPELRDAVLELLRNRSRREQIGKLARARAAKLFSVSELSGKMAAIYREMAL